MLSKKIEGKYRILLDGEHLPEEISQKEADEKISRLENALREVSSGLRDIYDGYDVVRRLVEEKADSACLRYDEGKIWNIDCLADELHDLLEELHNADEDVPSYEDAETIFDHGYKEEWVNSGVYSKIIEDTEEQEIVEEIVPKEDEFLYRRRTTIWEKVPGGRHSKVIRYEDLPIDENIERVVRNTFSGKSK